MKIKDVENLTYKYLKKHRLYDWKVGFQKKKYVLATCYHSTQTIKFSKWFIDNNGLDMITEAILHEIGHALVGSGWGHTLVWSAKCQDIGLKNPTECIDSAELVFPRAKYEGACICNFTFERERKIKKRFACPTCHGEITWIETKTNKITNFI